MLVAVSFEEIAALYPDQWVLVGDPDIDDSEEVGPMAARLRGGVVLLHGKDRREIAYKATEARQGFETVVLVFTGAVPPSRKYLL